MTREGAANMLLAKAMCMKREASGIDINCNHRNCDECELCYSQGTTGEQIEALMMAYDLINNITNKDDKGFTVIDVKTGKEADPGEIALHEHWAKNLIYCDMEGFAIEEDGSLILMDECGNYQYCPIGRFEVKWNE